MDQTADFDARTEPLKLEPALAPGDFVETPVSFGRYAVRGVLGRGGFGVVYLGHDSQLDRLVAIKVQLAGCPLTAEDRENFLQEARRVARLRHPSIVSVHDVGVEHDQCFIVSAFVKGVSLREWLKQNRPSWREAVRIVATLADALAHAHEQRTVHRDVKPANVILMPDMTPVLVDFGLGLDEAAAPGSQRGRVSGTPGYMSPEQALGEAHRIDGRTDIFSLGVMLYEMLCGRVPFSSADIEEVLRQIREDEPQPPRQLVRDLPYEIERICLKAMAKEIKHRYTTAGDFAEELRRAVASFEGKTIRGPDASLEGSLTTESAADRPAALSAGGPAPSAVGTPPVSAPSQRSASHGAASAERRARSAERRQVTILFCNCETFQSESFLESLDDEDQREVLRFFHRSCEEAVRQFDGTVLQSGADGIAVCFGFPIAYEDAARRAAAAALAIFEETANLNKTLERQHKLALTPWIGIHTGTAVAEVAADLSISVVGDARNVASRLADVAGPGTIVCTAAAHRLIGGYFDCDSLGRHKVKGVSQPVELHRVKSQGSTRSAIEVAVPAGLTPLTGRDHEVSLLSDRWEQAQEGMGQIVLIIGEAGLGKSRLVYTMKRHILEECARAAGTTAELDSASAVASHPATSSVAAGKNSPVIEWRCSPHYQNSSLFPAVDFFERFLAFGRAESPEEKFGKLVRHLEEYALAGPDVVPLFASLLSLPPDERFPNLRLSPVRQKERTLEVLNQWLYAYSERQPVLFIVEDLHWLDASSLEFLTQRVDRGPGDRVLTLFTFRPEFKTPWPAVAHQTSIALNRLTRRQITEMMRRKTGIEKLPDAIVDQVGERTGGVPLFVEEFTRMIEESGVLARAAEDSSLARSFAIHEIPATLQDLVMARLDRIASDKAVVQLAATLGREFSYELLAAVSPLDEQTLQAELDKLVQAELLYQKGRAPKGTYIFKHALLEDASYNSMVKSQRQQFHRQVADVIESRFPDTVEAQPELLAYHFSEAGETRKGVDYWLKAGLRARACSAEVEAIGHLTKGLELLVTLDESPERDGLEVPFQAQLGTAYLSTRGYAAPEVGPMFHRARALCEKADQPPQLFAVMWGTWAWHVVRGDFRLCMDLAAEAMQLAGKLNDAGITMEALFMPGLTMLYRADFAGAREHCGKAVAEFDDRERTKFWATHTGQNSGVTHRCYLSLALWHLGFPDQALVVNREMVELARTIGHPFSLAYAMHHKGWLHQHCRLGADTQAAGDEEMRIAVEQGFAFWHATGTLYRAAGLLQQGRLNEALPLIEKGLAAYRGTGAGLALPFYHSILGEALTLAGRFDDALTALTEGIAIAEKNQDFLQFAELHRLTGELAVARKPADEAVAEACFSRSVAIARQQRSRAWELRSVASLARLWNSQGKRDAARNELAAIYGQFTEGFGTPDLVDAKKLLDTLD